TERRVQRCRDTADALYLDAVRCPERAARIPGALVHEHADRGAVGGLPFGDALQVAFDAAAFGCVVFADVKDAHALARVASGQPVQSRSASARSAAPAAPRRASSSSRIASFWVRRRICRSWRERSMSSLSRRIRTSDRPMMIGNTGA